MTIRLLELKRTGLLLLLLLVMVWQIFALVGCERYEQIEVPEQKNDFAGRWSAGSNFFELEADGDVSLEIEGPNESFMIRSGSLRSLEGESICIGVGERQRSDCLPISEAPYSSGDQEVIRVGGVELTRE